MDANKLKAIIVENGLNQGKVAEKMGISKNSLSRKMQGKGDFTLSEARSLCSILKIDNPERIFF